MRLEAVVGSNVARIRQNRRLSQPDLGRQIGARTGERPWSRQSVSAMENGLRAFTARDLVMLAYLLEVPVSALLYVGPEVEEVELGSSFSLRRSDLEASGWQTDETTESLSSLASALGGLSERLAALQDAAYEADADAKRVQAATFRLRHLQSLESKGATIEEDYQ